MQRDPRRRGVPGSVREMKGDRRREHVVRRVFLAAGAALMSAASFADAGERPLKVFICAGQSNMVGRGAKASELPAELRSGQKRALFFDGRQWIALAPGKTERTGFGPEISFAHRMSALLGEPVGIIKHSVGGTDLAVKWSPTGRNSLYAQLVKKVAAARKGRRIEVVGFLWMQGERDSRFREKAGAYSKNLAGLIRAARRDFGNPRMLFVAGRVNPPKSSFEFVDLVRRALETCAEPGYAFIDCDTLDKGSDGLHYSTRGLVELGNRFADAVVKLARGGSR